MRAKQSQSAEAVVKDIRRQTRRKFTAEEKIRIVLEGLKGESICTLGIGCANNKDERGVYEPSKMAAPTSGLVEKVLCRGF